MADQRPIITVKGTRASYLGPSLDLKPHRNAAATFVMALEDTFDLVIDDPTGLAVTKMRMRAAIVPPNTRHHVRCRGLMAFIYFDGPRVDDRQQSHADFDRTIDAVLRAGPDRWRAWNIDDWSEASGLARQQFDRRVARTVEAMSVDPDRFGGLREAAKHAGLSPSRLQTLFREGLGVPFRRWRMWQRLTFAMTHIAQGASLTEAAHHAGFAHSAHFSSAFRAMFGLCPSALTGMKPEIRIQAPPVDRASVVERPQPTAAI